jgi:hypothetical protein
MEDGWMDKCIVQGLNEYLYTVDKSMGGWIDEWLGVWVGIWMNGWMDGLVDGWMGGWMDG